MKDDLQLTDVQEAEAQLIFERLKATAEAELMLVARLLASKDTGDIFGKTEFEVRDSVHRVGAAALESAVEVRKKNLPRL